MTLLTDTPLPSIAFPFDGSHSEARGGDIGTYTKMLYGRWDAVIDHIRNYNDHELDLFLGNLVEGIVPQDVPAYLQEFHSIDGRDNESAWPAIRLARMTGWWTPVTIALSEDIASKLTPGATILDPFAGRGWFKKAMEAQGFTVIATDSGSWGALGEGVERMDALESVHKYGSQADYLFIGWPPYNEPIDNKVLTAVVSGDTGFIGSILLAGEGAGGCTGSDEFHDNLPKYYEEVHFFEAHRRLKGYYDSVTLWAPRETA